MTPTRRSSSIVANSRRAATRSRNLSVNADANANANANQKQQHQQQQQTHYQQHHSREDNNEKENKNETKNTSASSPLASGAAATIDIGVDTATTECVVDSNDNNDGTATSTKNDSRGRDSTTKTNANNGNDNLHNDDENNDSNNNNLCDDDPNDHSNVVVKLLQPKLMENPRLFANCAAGLIREGLFLAALAHPHILKVHAWTTPTGWKDFAALSGQNGKLYDGYVLILERLRGGTLKRWLQHWNQKQHAEEQERAAAAAAAVAAATESSRENTTIGTTTGSTICSSSFSSAGRVSDPGPGPSCNHRSRWRRKTLFGGSDRNNNNKYNDIHQISGDATVSTANTSKAIVVNNHSNNNNYNECENKNNRHPYPSEWPTTQLSDRVGLLLQLSDTVRYLHKHRILHRDLKPDNLGVTYTTNNNSTSTNTHHQQNGSSNSGGRDNVNVNRAPTALSLKIFDFDIARLLPKEEHDHTNEETVPTSSSLSLLSSKNVGASVSAATCHGGLDRSTHEHTKSTSGGGSKKSAVTDLNSLSSSSFSLLDVNAAAKGQQFFNMTGKMGSPRYMAPEIARGEPYNLRSEAYTVCLLVHEILTLQRPYDELLPEHHGKLVHTDTPGYRPPIRKSWNWPTELGQVLESGWGDKRQRPSMKEVHSVLKIVLPELLVTATAPTVTTSLLSTTTANGNVKPSSSSSVPQVQLQQQQTQKKARSLFHRQKKKKKSVAAAAATASTSTSISPSSYVVHPISPSPSDSFSSEENIMETRVHLITDE